MDIFERPIPTKTRLPADHIIRQRLGEKSRGVVIDYVDIDTRTTRFIIQPVTDRFEHFFSLKSLAEITSCVNDNLIEHNCHINPEQHPDYFRYIVSVLAATVSQEIHGLKTPDKTAIIENLTDAILSRLPYDPILIMAVDDASRNNRLDVSHIKSADPIIVN